jgi:hypothetical protein
MVHPVEKLRMAVLPLNPAVTYAGSFLPVTILGIDINMRHEGEFFPL